MKLSLFLLALFTLIKSDITIAQTVDSINDVSTFEGIILVKGKKKILIPYLEKIQITTKSERFKGILDSVQTDRIFIGSSTISIYEIETITYCPSEKRKRGRRFLLSAGASLVAAVGLGLYSLAGAPEAVDFIGGAALLYTPIGAITGTILTNKKKFDLKKRNGWKALTSNS